MIKKEKWEDIKICCYAMCADEPKEFIDRWLDSMKYADYICVLITKRHNSNYKYLKKKEKEYKGKLIVKEKEIKPWRFDTARNESMKLIPKDSDILICTDIDEILIKDFFEDYKKCAFEHPEFERIYYRYAWSHDEQTNEPDWVFWYDKTCQNDNNWEWKYPVHEILVKKNGDKKYKGKYWLNGDKIYLHHYADSSKSRNSYLKLLELRMKENENEDDDYGLYYMAREYTFNQRWEEAIDTGLKLYSKLFYESCDNDKILSSSICILIGECLERIDKKEDAEFYYKKAIKADDRLRDGYIRLAQLYAYTDNANKAFDILDEMERKTRRVEDWRAKDYMWREWKSNQIKADAYCQNYNYPKAYECIQEGLKDIKTYTDIKNAMKEGFFTDLESIKEKYEFVKNQKVQTKKNFLQK